MPSKPAVLPLSPTTPFERAQVRFLSRLWTGSELFSVPSTFYDLYTPVAKALRDVCEKYRKAPTKWPVDALIVHPAVNELMKQRFADPGTITFQLQRALLLQGLLNKRKRGELKPRPSGAAKKKAAKKGK